MPLLLELNPASGSVSEIPVSHSITLNCATVRTLFSYLPRQKEIMKIRTGPHYKISDLSVIPLVLKSLFLSVASNGPLKLTKKMAKEKDLQTYLDWMYINVLNEQLSRKGQSFFKSVKSELLLLTS